MGFGVNKSNTFGAGLDQLAGQLASLTPGQVNQIATDPTKLPFNQMFSFSSPVQTPVQQPIVQPQSPFDPALLQQLGQIYQQFSQQPNPVAGIKQLPVITSMPRPTAPLMRTGTTMRPYTPKGK